MTRTIASFLLLLSAAIAQSPPPAPIAQTPYELVSAVKPNHTSDARLRIRMDDGAIYIENASLKDLLSNTYGMRGSLILDLPRWAEADHFDIKAKVLSDDSHYLQHMTLVQRRMIFQQLLAERFGLRAHV